MADGLTNDATPSRWQWHPQVREHWSGERLYFWRLRFPTYDRRRLLAGILTTMEQARVTAYTLYELYGGYDMLLRAWLPTTQGAFETTFNHVFREDPNIVIESFSVTKILTHWPWAMPNGEMRPLGDETLAERLPNAEIERINSGTTDLRTWMTYRDSGLVAVASHLDGIKFAIVIGNSHQPMTRSASDRAETRLREILLEAASITEKSLYKGIGFGSYLILGRVTEGRFSRIVAEITDKINATIAPETYGARTTTFITSTSGVLASRDSMRLSTERPRRRRVTEWLREEESQHLEFKGSAFLDLRPWLYADNPSPRGPNESQVPTHEVLKTVTGFLNAEGGTLVVGVLEAKRYAGHELLADAPRHGAYLIWGIQPEMRNGDWDAYELRLRDIFKSRIQPDPNDWIELARDGIGAKRPLCVISVRAPTRGNGGSGRWYYLGGRRSEIPAFFARQGNRTRELRGPEIDDYRMEKTRRATEDTGR